MNRIILLSILSCCTILVSTSQDLPRRASWEAKISYPINGKIGVTIESIPAKSPFEKAGLKVQDVILKVDNLLIDSDEKWTSATYAIRANTPITLLVKRGAEVFVQNVTLRGLDREQHTGLDTYYEAITSDAGIVQRTIITRPKGKSDPQPAIILIQGLSCSTIEKYSGRGSNWAQHLEDMVEKSNMVVMRVDKPGVGDSDGDCAQTDFHTELEGYRAAIRSLKAKPYVDTTKIVVYGASMGSALAPLLANEFNLAGVISDGTFFKTWFEHMLEIERRIRKMSGDDESTIVKKMNEAYIPLYYGMLIQKRSYQHIIKEYPAIRHLNYHSPEHMYGRPMAYYQQLQDLDLAGEWEKLQVPVRILYGTNDWIMSEFDNEMIIKVLDRVGHKDHLLVKYPGLDHWNTIHKSPDDSFHGRPGEWDPKVPELIIDWAKTMVK